MHFAPCDAQWRSGAQKPLTVVNSSPPVLESFETSVLRERRRVRTRHVSAQLHVPATDRGRRADVPHSQLQASPTVEQDVPYSTWKACAVNALRAKSKAPMVMVFEEGIVVVRMGGQECCSRWERALGFHGCCVREKCEVMLSESGVL